MSQTDLLVWGATGFTGRLVAAYLDAHAPEGTTWAIGGRDEAKLQALAATLSAKPALVLGDSLDAASMGAVAARCRTVISTVGPFARYGDALVCACAESGTDYCDITGETHWIRQNIDRYHDRAVQSGARIVHCCGFDSIPSDLGVWMLHDHLQRENGSSLASARFYLMKSKGGFSGGTVASMLELMEQVSNDRALRRLLANPYALVPETTRRAERDRFDAAFDDRVGRWTAPFLMAAINTRIVHRSNALLGYPYGEEFRYSEAMVTRSRMQAMLVRWGLGALVAIAGFRAGRWTLRRFLASPGEGPSAGEREDGHFTIRIFGRSDAKPAQSVQGLVRGELDPGYGETSKMLAESGLCLAADPIGTAGGISTPAAALGPFLLKRLRRAGMTFQIEKGTD